MEVNIADLTWSSFVYPRGGKNEKTVEAYVEALRIGAQFPPIKIQRVFNYPKDNEKIEATLILDGIHRWLAFKECGFKKIKAIEWKKAPLNYETSQIALLLEAGQCNTRHGDRLSPKDKRQIARDIATSDPECRWTGLPRSRIYLSTSSEGLAGLLQLLRNPLIQTLSLTSRAHVYPSMQMWR